MLGYDKIYPLYGFAGHKGYPTPQHKALVLSKGPCDIHRKSFRPVKDWYQRHKPEVHEKWEAIKKQRAEERKSRLSKEKKAKGGNKKTKAKKSGKAKTKGSGKATKGKNAKGGSKQRTITGFMSSAKTEHGDDEQKEMEEEEYVVEEEEYVVEVKVKKARKNKKVEDQYLIDSEDDI